MLSQINRRTDAEVQPYAPHLFFAGHLARAVAFALCVAVFSQGLCAPAAAETRTPGDTWSRLSALPNGARMHISADEKSKTCNFVSADDEKLVCSSGRASYAANFTFLRTEVKSVKLTRYGLSTLAGAGIGAGAGAAVGGIANSRDKGGFLNLSSIVIGVTTLGGALVGAAICGPLDSFRGPTVYRRPGMQRPPKIAAKLPISNGDVK